MVFYCPFFVVCDFKCHSRNVSNGYRFWRDPLVKLFGNHWLDHGRQSW